MIGELILLAWLGAGIGETPEKGPVLFNGGLAREHVAEQVAFGPRPTGSEAIVRTGDWILQRLSALGWTTSDFVRTLTLGTEEVQVRNLVATLGQGPIVLLGAHYDTRLLADEDEDHDRRTEPVLGANDGGSGTAVLLELARVIAQHHTPHQEIRLLFFDAEDNGRIFPWTQSGQNGWIIGSTLYAQSLDLENTDIRFMILVDMVGDMMQRFPKELRSHLEANSVTTGLWNLAQEMGYGDNFPTFVRGSIIDDHVPFLNRGIPAVDIIDLDYPHWHTTQDTLDKISAESLERVGRLIQNYLIKTGTLDRAPLSAGRPPRTNRTQPAGRPPGS